MLLVLRSIRARAVSDEVPVKVNEMRVEIDRPKGATSKINDLCLSNFVNQICVVLLTVSFPMKKHFSFPSKQRPPPHLH